MKKILLFGSGKQGEKALSFFGSENVEAFLDNNKNIQGNIIDNIMVKDVTDYLNEISNYEIVITTDCWASIALQLRKLGITEYKVWNEIREFRYYDTNDLIVYPFNNTKKSEDECIKEPISKFERNAINDEVEILYNQKNLFNHIEVETINRCNGTCAFCPVNKKNDPRELKIMTEECFKNIVDQLAELNYRGRFAAFSNNEPLLDDRIIEFSKYARKKIPNARIHLFTNATLMTMDKFIELIDLLDEMVIDNYHPSLELIKPCIEIKKYCETHTELKRKVTIAMRDPNQIMSTRGGNAPNRNQFINYNDDRCLLPYKQMIIRPDGKVSLCCNDALGEYTLGDTTKDSLIEIWYGKKFENLRRIMYEEGRKGWGNCKVCDNFQWG